MAIYALGDRVPEIDVAAYVHPDATIIGSAIIGSGASIWPQAVIRADDNAIEIGEGSSIQDGAVLHCTPNHRTRVGRFVTVGHLAHLEGCHVLDRALIGSGSVVLNNAVVEEDAVVGAGAVVPGGLRIPRCALALGVPVILRENVFAEGHAQPNADAYIARGESYAAELRRVG